MHRRVRKHLGKLALSVLVTAGACATAQTYSQAAGSLDLAGATEIEGVVHEVHAKNGWFTMDAGGHVVTLSIPAGLSQEDLDRVKALRTGDQVDLYGVEDGSYHMELRHFHLID